MGKLLFGLFDILVIRAFIYPLILPFVSIYSSIRACVSHAVTNTLDKLTVLNCVLFPIVAQLKFANSRANIIFCRKSALFNRLYATNQLVISTIPIAIVYSMICR